MKMYLSSISDKVWDVVENEFVVIDPTNLTDNDKINKQWNTMALNTIYNDIDSKVFERIKDLEKASEVWVRLEEIYEGTSMVRRLSLGEFVDSSYHPSQTINIERIKIPKRGGELS